MGPMPACRCYFHNSLLPESIRSTIHPVCTIPNEYMPKLCDGVRYEYGDFKTGFYTLHEGDLWRSYRAVNQLYDHTKNDLLQRGLPSNSLVEVTHTCCDFTDTRNSWGRPQGLWHYLNPGSGIWFNLGRTLVSDDSAFTKPREQTGCGGDHCARSRDQTSRFRPLPCCPMCQLLWLSSEHTRPRRLQSPSWRA